MKPSWQKQRNHAWTMVELWVVIVVLITLVILLLPWLVSTGTSAQHINCVSNLKQVNLSFRIWEGDNNNEYPMGISITNGGGMESVATGNVVDCFQVMSNELSTPKILICPADFKRIPATNFDNDFNASHISYFIAADVTNEDNPKMLLIGDDNLAINGTSVKSGLSALSTNFPVTWTATRHRFCGNIAHTDGSVWEVSTMGLQQALQQTGLATNRLAIP
jgi:competence protein ComGC